MELIKMRRLSVTADASLKAKLLRVLGEWGVKTFHLSGGTEQPPCSDATGFTPPVVNIQLEVFVHPGLSEAVLGSLTAEGAIMSPSSVSMSEVFVSADLHGVEKGLERQTRYEKWGDYLITV
jgi:hypothetical protein